MIKVFTGPMFSGKSKGLFEAYDSIYNKSHIIVFKPVKDTRTPGVIATRVEVDESGIKKEIYREISAVEIDSFEQIIDAIYARFLENPEIRIRTLLIDEAMLLEGNVAVLAMLSITWDMDIYISGLDKTAEQEPFGSMPDILAMADSIVKVMGSCYDCGREAQNTYYTLGQKEEVVIGSEGYIPICDRCLRLRHIKEKGKSFVMCNVPSELTKIYM